VLLVFYLLAKFVASAVPEIWKGSQNFKSRSRDAVRESLLSNFAFSIVRLMINLLAEFEVYSFNGFQDIEGF